MRRTGAWGAAALVGLVAGCEGTLPPLRGQIRVGRDAYAIFVAGSAAGGDLYAVHSEGGPAIPITFSTVGEMRPRLSADGTRLAFLRGRAVGDTTPGSVWVMNLQTGSEHEVELPPRADPPTRVGWARDDGSLVVATESALYRAGVPPDGAPATPVAPAARASAESALAVLLGDTVFARVELCPEAEALCVQGDTGAPGLLASGARDAARWGGDSVAFLMGSVIEVRPLGPGHARRITWSGGPGAARELTAFGGQGGGGRGGDSS
ncbi:MAG: hypothetical protein ACTHM9_03725 [Gemmatimonadales bacterium]